MLHSIRVIGRGGFGNVDQVVDAAGNSFARKTFSVNQPLPDDLQANVLKRFVKEVRTQSAINCRNIVPVLLADLTASPPFYVMPLAVDSLNADIARDRTLGGSFLSAFADIVAGLDVIHSMHIFHRDLKPQNVLRFTDAAGGADFYAISDFGLISLQESQLSVLTSTGMGRGADHYTAPEVIQDLRRATVQSDVYSLGCILHDFVGQQSRVPCGEIKEAGPYGAILSGCTRRDPAQRFKSVRAVLDAVLSVGTAVTVPLTARAADYVQLLRGDVSIITKAQWIGMFECVSSADFSDIRAIFMALSDEAIRVVCSAFPEEAKLLGLEFARWVGSSTFNFEHCDGLANRVEAFFEGSADFELKSNCMLALLSMGTSHNRWYVEHMFKRLASPAMDGNLAARLAIEFRILDSEVCRQVSHFERSIDSSRDTLHPALINTLKGICG